MTFLSSSKGPGGLKSCIAHSRELTNKNKCVFKRTHVCLCVYLCVLSKSVLKSVFFASLGLVDIWFG